MGRIAAAAPVAGGLLLDWPAAHDELVRGQIDHVERIHYRPLLRDGRGCSGVIASKPDHRDNFEPNTKGLIVGLELIGEVLRRVAGDERHTVETGRFRPLPG